jgi:hypothetical protein
LSQLSISKEKNTKKKKVPTTADALAVITAAIDSPSVNVVPNEVTDDNPSEMDLDDNSKLLIPTNRIPKFKPHYLALSDQLFKEILSNGVPDGDKMVQCLNTDEKLQSVRQMTEITNNLHYFDLQQHLWQAYYNIGIKEN